MEEEKGLKRTSGKRQSWLRREWMADQVTYISPLTNNVIGHALEETPSRIKGILPLPPCDGMKSLKDGAS